MAATLIPVPMEETAGGAELNERSQACPEILGAIYVAHYGYVLKVCQRFFRQREDAEDAASEVFLKLQKIAHKKDANVPFRPWVSRVAGRHCIDMLRHRKSEKKFCVTGIDASRVPDGRNSSPLSQVQHREEQRVVMEQLMRLPGHYMVPLVLHYYKEMSYVAIARKLNKGLPAVKITMFRAKHQLRRNLGRFGTTSPCKV